MKLNLILVACSAWFGVMAQSRKPLTNSTNGFLSLTNNWDIGTNFLTLTNRVWVQMEGSAIVRVTDDEWNLITNYYHAKLTTKTLSFYGK